MKSLQITFLLIFLLLSTKAFADKPLEIGIRDPDKKINAVEYYTFHWVGDKRPKMTKYFTYEQQSSAYSLKFSEPSNYITKDTHYVKTFGGMAPTVRIEVIANRFIAFPETIRGSEIKDSDSQKWDNPMKGITRVYDIKTGKIIFTSKPYTYDHDVPLVYNLAELVQLAQSH